LPVRRGSKVYEAIPAKMGVVAIEVKAAWTALMASEVTMELRVHQVLLGIPAVTELERTHGAERQNMAILVISRLCTSQ
jgi:hypothetical protein